MTDASTIPIDDLLLMAAEVLDLGPATDLSYANAAKACNQVLRWHGINEEEIRDGWWAADVKTKLHQLVHLKLQQMIAMAQQDGTFRSPERPGEPLFQGGGNWGVVGSTTELGADPHYKSCRLTPHGQALAKVLLTRYPDLQPLSA